MADEQQNGEDTKKGPIDMGPVPKLTAYEKTDCIPIYDSFFEKRVRFNLLKFTKHCEPAQQPAFCALGKRRVQYLLA